MATHTLVTHELVLRAQWGVSIEAGEIFQGALSWVDQEVSRDFYDVEIVSIVEDVQ